MNEQRIKALAAKVAEFVLSEVSNTDVTPAEVSYALGEALAIVVASSFLKGKQEWGELPRQPGEDEQEDEDEDEFEYQSENERAYGTGRLSARYPDGTVYLISMGVMPVPGWLRKEILERRG